MSQTFTYTFTDSSGSDTIEVTTSATTSPFLGTDAYAVTSISGTINGVPITGEVGTPLAVQTSSDGNAIFDNAIFPIAGTGGSYGGASGNTYGIDVYGLEFSAGGQEYNLYTDNGVFQAFETSDPGDQETLTLESTNAPCFCAGTLIRTPQGEAEVESLKIGELILTVDGPAEPICWIGRRKIVTRFADPLHAYPIRIKAGALGAGLPVRDLRLSPDHAMLVDGVLIHAAALVNGCTIVREEEVPAVFTYYHIETANHALLFAEGAAAETFVDNVDRMNFDNWAEREAAVGSGQEIQEMPYPRAKSARQVPASIRAKLGSVSQALAATTEAGSLAA